jgi:hypothetical protein
MANEITYTGDAGSLRSTEILNSMVWDLLYDGTDLRSICIKLADLGGSGSDTSKTAQVNLGTAMTAAAGDEVTATGNTALPVSSLSLSVASQIIAYELSDLMQITQGAGNVGMDTLARAVAASYIVRFTELACVAGSGFSNTVGTTTQDLLVDDFYAAIYQLEQTANNLPFACVLYPTQFTDLQESLRSEGGAVQFMPATAETLKAHGQGYKGQFLGVDIWTSASVPTANAGDDSAGFMMSGGGVAYVEASARGIMPGATMAPAASPIFAEFDRVSDPGLSRIVAHAYLGVGISEDDKGVAIITDR